MIENPVNDSDALEPDDDLSPADAAAYISDLCRQMAGMARRVGLEKTASALERARNSAAEDLNLDS